MHSNMRNARSHTKNVCKVTLWLQHKREPVWKDCWDEILTLWKSAWLVPRFHLCCVPDSFLLLKQKEWNMPGVLSWLCVLSKLGLFIRNMCSDFWKPCYENAAPLLPHWITMAEHLDHVQECTLGVNKGQIKTSLYQFLAGWRVHWNDELNKTQWMYTSAIFGICYHFFYCWFCCCTVILAASSPTTIINCTITWLTSQSHRSNCKINKMTSK